MELSRKGYRPFHDIQYLEIKDGRHNQETWAQAMPNFLTWALAMDNKIILKTLRLILREFIPEDATNMFELNADPEIISFHWRRTFQIY